MKRRIRLSPAALLDLDETFSYLESRHPPAASRWLNGMERYFNLLAEQPGLGVGYDYVRAGMRRAIKNDYKILYRIADDEIVIVRILHPRRDLDFSLLD